MMSKCDKCGAEEDTPASKESKCFFCKEGIMQPINLKGVEL